MKTCRSGDSTCGIPGQGKVLESLLGTRIRIHYTLERCPKGKGPYAGELCFAIRARGNGRVSAYVKTFVLTDVKMVVSEAGIKRVRKIGRRKVIAHYEGTLDAVDQAVSHRGLERIWFDPFIHHKFMWGPRDHQLPIEYSERVVGDGRETWAKVA